MEEPLDKTDPIAHLLDNEDVVSYDDATGGQRFMNLLIDNIFMRFVLSYATGYVLGLFLGYFFRDFLVDLLSSDGYGSFFLLWILSLMNYLLYYLLCEKLFKGITLGKLITGTKAVREDGNEMTFRDVMSRTLVRMIPFEALSAFGGYPWHDTWTQTKVIKTR